MNFKNLFLAVPLLLSACGPIRDMQELVKTTREMNGNTKDLTKGMDKTNDSTHDFALMVALGQLTEAVNTETLTPPARMLPYAKGFTKLATAHEIIQAFHTFWTDVQFGGATDKDNPTPDDVRLRSRRISMAAASGIAAFTPEDKFAEILATEVDGKKRFEESAYAFALCRYNFVRDFMFRSIVDNARDINLGALQDTATYFAQLKKIAALPYVAKMEFSVSSFNSKVVKGKVILEDVVINLDPNELANLGRSANRRFQRELPNDVKASAEAQALLNQLK
jgi:hypothetical protein